MSEFDEASPVPPNRKPPVGEIPSVSDEAGAMDYIAEDLKKARRRKSATPDRIDRLPPHSNEAEQGLLGCCLLDAKSVLPQVIAKTNGNSEICYDLRHETILANLFTLFQNGVGIDVITVQERLKDFQLLDQVGGVPYLNALVDCVPSAANWPYYLEIILEKFMARRAIAICTDTAGRAYEFDGDINALIDEVERDVLTIRRDLTVSESSGMKELVPQSIVEIEQCYTRDGTISGLSTGFMDLDRMTDGLHGGEMIVIAARPSMGKTSLAMNVAEHVAMTLRLPVGVFSLEMTSRSLTTRILCSRARVNLRNIREGFMSEADFPKLTAAAGRLQGSPLRIDDTPSLSIMSLRARARTMWQQYQTKLFIVDYLQLLHSTSKRAQSNRQIEISEISAGIKALAKELNVPVVVLSQLNREMERDKSRRPRLSDLRESGSIEQDADVVGLLYKPVVDEDKDVYPEPEEADGLAVNLLIAKQRNGPTGDVNLTFLKPYTRFESAAKVSGYDVPEDQTSLPYKE